MNNRRHYYSLILLVILFSFSVVATAAVPVATQVKLIANDAFKDAGFGWAVAIDGDTAVVSAFADYDNKGAAYVFERTDTGWQQVAKLTASDGTGGGESGDLLGMAAAISGDTIALGAPLDDNENGTDAGAVYVYVKPEGGWPATMTETVKLLAPNTGGDRGFGTALALKEGTLAVGAPGKDASLIPGEVFIFQGTGANWTAKATLSVDGLNGSDSFGTAVDYDGETLVVGAFGKDNMKGAVYLYQRPADGWKNKGPDAVLAADDGEDKDFFGGSVAVDGDTLLVGANGDDDHGAKSGAAYVFTRTGGVWSQRQKLVASDAHPVGNFGYAVDLAGGTAIIGASHFKDDVTEAVYVFARKGNEWKEQGKLTDPDGNADSRFGLSVAIDTDGLTILAGAIGADAGTTQAEQRAGAAYLFRLAAPVELALVKKDDVDPVRVGDEVRYTLMVTNNGEEDATNVVVIDTLPAELSYLSDDGGCTVSGNVVSCNLGTVVKQGGVSQVTIRVRAEAAGNVTNTATVNADENDADYSNNADSEQTTIEAQDAGDGETGGGGGGGGSLDIVVLLMLLSLLVVNRKMVGRTRIPSN